MRNKENICHIVQGWRMVTILSLTVNCFENMLLLTICQNFLNYM